MEDRKELEIISECKKGNWQNFGILYEKYMPKIYQYLYYRVRHKQTAEDLTATVFFKTVRGINSFQKDKKSLFQSWLYGIARNALIDHLRSEKPSLELNEDIDVVSSEDILDKTDSLMKLESIKAGLKNLTPNQREVVTLRVWDGLSHKEISEILDISESNSKITFSRAVLALKQTIPLSVIAIIFGSSI